MNDEIQSIQFGIMSTAQIKNQSVVCISSTDGDNSVYDKRMGPCSDDLTRCITCFKMAIDCSGHFGHIDLVEPIPNPLFITRLISYFGIFCWNCSSRVLADTPKKRENRNECYLSILTAKSRNSKCHKCDYQQKIIYLNENRLLVQKDAHGETRIDTRRAIEMLSKIDSVELKRIGVDATFARPENHLFEVLPVLPPLNRPFMLQGTQICDDDLTSLYSAIVKNNENAKKLNPNSPQYLARLHTITFNLQILANNSSGNAKHPSSGRKIKGIFERMTGKEGLLRNNTMGKRCDQTARAVAAPGPTLSCGQVGISEDLAKVLTRSIKCTSENINELQTLCDNGGVDRVERILNGIKCEFGVAKFRHQQQTRLDPGDFILRPNQLPTKVETGHEVLATGDFILRGKETIPAIAASIRKFPLFPNDLVACYLRDGDLVISNRQPTLHTGNIKASNVVITKTKCCHFVLSDTNSSNMDFDGDEANIHVVQSPEAVAELDRQAHSRKTIISSSTSKPYATLVQDTLLALFLLTRECFSIPKDLISEKDVKRVNKVRQRLSINTSSEPDSLMLVSSCLPRKLIYADEKIQIVFGVWICGTFDKHTSQVLTLIVAQEFGADTVSDMLTRFQHKAVKWLSRRGFTIDSSDILPFPHQQVKTFCDKKANEGESVRTIRDELHSLALEQSHSSNIRACIDSGAKGTLVNIGQIVAIVGQQQSKSGGVIEATLHGNRVVAQDSRVGSQTSLEKFEKHGFIVNSFAHGLTPQQFFLLAMPARAAIVDTAKGTANSGYLQHRIVKIADDAVIENGQVVFNSGKPKTISLNYNNGRNPFSPKINQKYIQLKRQLGLL